MNDSAQVNQVYLIFNRPQFLVDSSDSKYETIRHLQAIHMAD